MLKEYGQINRSEEYQEASPTDWYYSYNQKPYGPLNYQEMKEKIQRGEISLGTLIFSERDQEWREAKSFKDFNLYLFPANQSIEEDSDIEDKKWVLLEKNAAGDFLQKGPFSLLEIQALIQQGNAEISDYIWKPGMTGWARIMERHEFNG